ncbi:MAG: hypothetical protein JWO25_400 [Alphaproteobacteria bacterium]|nr:hypothetical protein [Alphaproteobacteria bacterium]MDB5721193.1 hypothetical protein [Alphaproteobacteria bacterium]
MTKWTSKFESGFTAALWIAAAILLPMAALAPVDGGRAEAGTVIASACMGSVATTLRACSIIPL